MSDNKKYYWLKLPTNFFEDKAIKRLRQLAGGDTYTIIYLKMLLKSLEDNGKLFYEGIEDTIADEIALDINESNDDVQVTINYLIQKGLMQVTESEAEMLRINEMVGSETDSAKRVRKHRALQCNANPLQSNTTVTTCNTVVTKCNTEIEKDIEIDKEKDIKKKETRFVKPTQEEIQEYVDKIGKPLDVSKFYDYYESNGWIVGKAHMKDWRATVRNWIRRNETYTGSNNAKQQVQVRDSSLDDYF